MNSPTFRYPMPAADPRTGRGERAPRGTQYRIGVPFAALPHDIAADRRLTPTDLRVLAALLFYACSKPTCYPSDAGIADRVHKHPGTIRRSLKRLEDLGYIRREFVPATLANPTGRLIHLTFTAPDWSRPHQEPVPTPERRRAPVPERRRTSTPRADAHPPRAQAHTEENVIVKQNEEEPDGIDRPLRSRPATPATQPEIQPPHATPAPIAQSVVLSPEPSESILTPQEAVLSEPVAGYILVPAIHGPSRGDLAVPASHGPTSLPLDLGAIGKPMTGQPMAPMVPCPSPTPRPAFQRKKLGLDLAELASIVGETADPILAAELARRTAPPGPPEPPPATLPTVDLFRLLPGRHDLIAAVTQRLAMELGDFKVVSWKFFQQAILAVVTRSVPPEVLLDCHRQAMGPTVKNRGSVFVVAWQREVPPRC